MRRGKRGRTIPDRPDLSIAQVLAWADAHHARTGGWPNKKLGEVSENSLERWHALDGALRVGCRGLPGGISLAGLLDEQRGVRNRKALPPYTITGILAWADAHRARTGEWPTRLAGPIADAPGET